MFNQLFDGISMKLNQVFGDGCKVYSDKVRQGLKEPCFFIKLLNPSQSPLLGSRRFRTNSFDIHYFPKANESNEDVNEVVESLFEALEYITLPTGDLVRGTNLHAENVDGVVHFFVNYNLFTRKDEVHEPMEDLTVQAGTKG